MVLDPTAGSSFRCSIAPWLSMGSSAKAVDFYKSAFGTTEAYRLEVPGGGVVARLSVEGAEFCLSEEPPETGNIGPESLGGGPVRMILTVVDPDAVFARALMAGASEIFPVGEDHGWRLGRVVDLSVFTGRSAVRWSSRRQDERFVPYFIPLECPHA
jgi:PhnB protein